MTQVSNQSDGTSITSCDSCPIADNHTVTFHGNDSCCSRACGLSDPITVPYSRNLTLPDIVPIRRGYCFCQWNTGRCYDGAIYLPGETLPPLTEDLDLYAVWKENRSGCPCPPPAPAASFTAQKLDTTTGAPVAGASYTLSQDGVVLMDSISDSLGRITFTGLRPGIYELEETSAPSGYEPDATMHQVIVDTDGTVTIDGRPADSYILYNQPAEDSRPQSERPVIISVEEGDSVVTGTGIPGATITVLLPDGTQADTTVDTDGRWTVPVPSASGLHAGDTVYASQTVPGLGPSDNASFVVQPHR